MQGDSADSGRSAITQPAPQRMLFYRDSLLPGQEAAFEAIERDAARFCAELSCPNVHLAIESLSGPKEVWWLTPYASEADKERIVAAYANNAPLSAALAAVTKRRVGVVGASAEVFTKYRPDLSRGAHWEVEGARFFVVTVTNGESPLPGCVYEAPDGARYVVRQAATRDAADDLARRAGPGTTVFAIRPYWGMPAQEWIAADPEFWKVSPVARQQ